MENEEIKCTACDGKGWLPHTPPPVEGEKEERTAHEDKGAEEIIKKYLPNIPKSNFDTYIGIHQAMQEYASICVAKALKKPEKDY